MRLANQGYLQGYFTQVSGGGSYRPRQPGRVQILGVTAVMTVFPCCVFLCQGNSKAVQLLVTDGDLGDDPMREAGKLESHS